MYSKQNTLKTPDRKVVSLMVFVEGIFYSWQICEPHSLTIKSFPLPYRQLAKQHKSYNFLGHAEVHHLFKTKLRHCSQCQPRPSGLVEKECPR